MDNRNTLVGWSDDQWSQIRQAVSDEAHKARVAASFLKTYGLLSPSTQVVPSERVNHATLRVDDTSTAQMLELFVNVQLSQQQMKEEELSTALLAFRRAANIVARGEDWIIFNGQHLYRIVDGKPVAAVPDSVAAGRTDPALQKIPPLLRLKGGEQHEAHPRESLHKFVEPILESLTATELAVLPPQFLALFSPDKAKTTDVLALLPADKKATTASFSGRIHVQFLESRLQATNPGGLGLVHSTTNAHQVVNFNPPSSTVEGIIAAVTTLEGEGHLAPFVCVLGKEAFIATHRPEDGKSGLPSDQIEPILGSQLLRCSVIGDYQGVVVSLAGDPVDLAVAVDASPQFLNVNDQGQYRFRVVERFALRVKEPEAIVRLDFVDRLVPPKAASP